MSSRKRRSRCPSASVGLGRAAHRRPEVRDRMRAEVEGAARRGRSKSRAAHGRGEGDRTICAPQPTTAIRAADIVGVAARRELRSALSAVVGGALRDDASERRRAAPTRESNSRIPRVDALRPAFERRRPAPARDEPSSDSSSTRRSGASSPPRCAGRGKITRSPLVTRRVAPRLEDRSGGLRHARRKDGATAPGRVRKLCGRRRQDRKRGTAPCMQTNQGYPRNQSGELRGPVCEGGGVKGIGLAGPTPALSQQGYERRAIAGSPRARYRGRSSPRATQPDEEHVSRPSPARSSKDKAGGPSSRARQILSLLHDAASPRASASRVDRRLMSTRVDHLRPAAHATRTPSQPYGCA